MGRYSLRFKAEAFLNHPADLWFVFEDFRHFFGYVFEFGFVKLYVGQQANDVCLD